VVAEEGALILSGFGEPPPLPESPLARRAVEAVRAYFEGAPLPAFPLGLRGPPFFQRVWAALAATRPGEVLTYGELAARAGRPGAARAAGRAMAENPLPLFVPCHRVIRSDGRLGRYGPATWRKAALHPDLAAVRLGDLLGDGEP